MGMPGSIAQGPILLKVDAAANDPAKREAFLADLNTWTDDYVEVLEKHARLTAGEVDYLKKSWFNPEGLWPDLQPIESPHRQGLITAIDVATEDEAQLPIASYWVCVSTHFEIILTRTQQQVTRLIITPFPPNWGGQRLSDQIAPIWSIRAAGLRGEQIVQTENQEVPVIIVRPLISAEMSRGRGRRRGGRGTTAP